MIPRGVKLFWAIGALLVATVVAAVLLCPWVFPSARVSDLYNRYKDNPHLAVTYLQNFPLNDTLSVDVTTISATDDEGWDTLKSNFNVKPIPDMVQMEFDKGKDIVGVFLALKKDPTLPMDTVNLTNNNVIGVSHLHKTISIFDTETEAQIDAANHYNLRKSI